MKPKRDWAATAVAWIVFLIAAGFLFWVIGGLYATFAPVRAAEPAVIRVVGTPSAFRAPGDIYMRWHYCLGCD